MPIDFSCPYCGKQTEVAAQYAGQTGPCSACGKTITVPELPHGAPPGNAGKPGNSMLAALAVLGIGGSLLLGLALLLIFPLVSLTRGISYRTQSANNLKMIGIALHNYHDMYGQFPPQYVCDKEGTPLYSWRVLLLPFLEQDAIYQAWDKTKAWDSPENQHLSSLVIPVFLMPDEPAINNGTSYLAICGPNTLFDGSKSIRLQQVTDGTSNTMIVVESRSSGIGWAEPKDVALDSLASVNTGTPGQINGNSGQGATVLMGDGSVHLLPQATPATTLHLLGNRQDGTPVMIPKQ